MGLLKPRRRLLCFSLKNATFHYSLLFIHKISLKNIFIEEKEFKIHMDVKLEHTSQVIYQKLQIERP